MKFINIAICDVDKLSVKILKCITSDYFDKRHIQSNFSIYTDTKSLLQDFEEDYLTANLLFMDSAGIDTCRILRKKNFNEPIVLTAESEKNAILGYDIDARAYILKPYDYNVIFRHLDHIFHSLNGFYTIQKNSQIIHIPLYRILFCESNGSRCIIHCKEIADYTIYKKLSDVEAEICDNHFIRCHQSYLVNMDYIIKADNCFILSTGDIIPIRQSKLKQIKDYYLDYSKGEQIC